MCTETGGTETPRRLLIFMSLSSNGQENCVSGSKCRFDSDQGYQLNMGDDRMFVNELPIWLPIGNIVTSIIGLVLAIWIIKEGKYNKLIGLGFACFVLVCVAGALFQANIIGLPLWIILGTGGRIIGAGLLLAGSVYRADPKK